MVALETPQAVIGWKAADFSLKGVDGKTYSLENARGPNGLWLMFICNHCPYVQKQMDRIVSTAKELEEIGVGSIAIMPNDTENYPDDSFDNMQQFADERQMTFPYVIDDTQEIARAYGAVCTPDFFGFNKKLELQYRGRLDQSWSNIIENPERELFLAMKEVAETGKTERPQNPSVGCSIKWKTKSSAA